MNLLIQKAILRIPQQLHQEDFKFVPLWNATKKPFEMSWNVPGSKTNYPFDHPKLAAFLLEGHNYGVCAGMGDLIVFDADEIQRLEELGIIKLLPKTFTVRTGGGGIHRYYICHDMKEKAILFDLELKDESGKPLHLGEIQTLGFQVVGAGSIHPNGNRYVVEEDLPIAEISWQDLYAVLEGKVEFGIAEAPKKKKHFAIRVKDPGRYDPFEDVHIENVLYPQGAAKKRGSIIKGSHPVHGSKTGHNFQINTDKNTFFCYRCWKGGGPALAIAIKEGLLRCDQAGKGVLRGELFRELFEVAEVLGYIKRRLPMIEIRRWEE